MLNQRPPKSVSQGSTEQVLDGCTRLKAAVVKLKQRGCVVLGAFVPGKNPTITIEPPHDPALRGKGESWKRREGAGGRELVTYMALFENCRVEWTLTEGRV